MKRGLNCPLGDWKSKRTPNCGRIARSNSVPDIQQMKGGRGFLSHPRDPAG